MREYWFYFMLNCMIKITHCTESNQIARVFLTGDVMLGRGIDQILKYPSNPHFPLNKKLKYDNNGTAIYYIKQAEQTNGKLPSHEITSQPHYIWGDLIDSFHQYNPDVKLFNIETSITTSETALRRKGIWYRMNPKNIYTLNTINNDQKLICTFANNHVFDWGHNGFSETIETLTNNNISFVGIGQNVHEAWKPSVIELKDKNCRIFVFGVGSRSSGIYRELMYAKRKKHGIAMVNPYDSSQEYIDSIMKKIETYVLNYIAANDAMNNIIILSIHWGSNWNWNVKKEFRMFAHALIDYNSEYNIGIDLIHGHSSHHIKAIEIYKNKAILYGCGELLDDYEGLHVYNEYKNDLGFMYFVDLDVLSGNVENIILKGIQIKRFQITYAKNGSLIWLQDTMQTLCKELNVTLYVNDFDGTLCLNEKWVEDNGEYVQNVEYISMRTFNDFGVKYLYWSLLIVLAIVVLNVPLCRWFIQKM